MELQLVQNLKAVDGVLKFNNAMPFDDVRKVASAKLITIDSDMAHRAHVISYVGYGTADFADVILVYNSISNPFYIPEGSVIKLPNLEELEIALVTWQDANNANVNTIRAQSNTVTNAKQKSATIASSNGRIVFKSSV